MARRTFIGPADGTYKFRITKPGLEVDARYATVDQCLFHETMLFTQPYWFGFVACPFAGSTDKALLSQTATVAIPDFGVTDPVVNMYAKNYAAQNCFPRPASIGSGNSQDGYASEAWQIRLAGVTTNSISIEFTKPALSIRSPLGCYVTLMRKAA